MSKLGAFRKLYTYNSFTATENDPMRGRLPSLAGVSVMKQAPHVADPSSHVSDTSHNPIDPMGRIAKLLQGQ